MEQKIKLLIVLFFVLSLAFLFLCIQRAGYKIPGVELQTNKPISEKVEERNVGMINHASENCGFKKGNLEMRKNPGGSEYGVCVFAEGKECEEWALYKGDCLEGGVDVSGVYNEAVKFCLITGNKYLPTSKECEFKDGKKCLAVNFFEGNCQ
jgi:putative hemolysin